MIFNYESSEAEKISTFMTRQYDYHDANVIILFEIKVKKI